MASNDPATRHILPQDLQSTQNPQMASFAFTPQHFPQRETQKNYVFVDEHNRHKRLKVMRACEGCRRRKIKCDAATTNTWPCSACIRLKLHCVRPNGHDGSADLTSFDPLVPTSHFHGMGLPYQGPMPIKQEPDLYVHPTGYPDGNAAAFQTLSYDHSQSHHHLHYTTLPPPMPLMDHHLAQQNAYSAAAAVAAASASASASASAPTSTQQTSQQASSPAYSADSYQQDLSDVLGSLKLSEIGTAPYLRNKASFRREDPAVEEDDDYGYALPPLSTGAGHKIRIPPALMPDDATALDYFELYFTHVHPYVPVLNRSLFYQQWTTARDSISPLMLEALFAIGGKLADDPAQGHQWLALASRHSDAFMDTPRLSTLQALLMILKAREGAPKRGYFYRSWMSIVQCVQMAKDLSLDDHYDQHQMGGSCEFDHDECQIRTRVWQTIFVIEVMVGAPQGRFNFSVDLESVDFDIPSHVPGEDETEYMVSRNFAFFARNVRNVARMSQVYRRLKKVKDWGVNPDFLKLERDFEAFQAELPGDLVITFPADGSPPWIPSAFLGNLHSYYYLTIIIFNRPLLSFLDPINNEAEWKRHMMICYNAAKSLCRLQEAVLASFGLTGLQCMQRGFSFTLYGGLSCIVLHLVAITSPDPDFHRDGREYFTRHMRVVEQIMEAWSMPELQKQIDAVREAFSADIRKPFVLKPSFPYGSPPAATTSPTVYHSGIGQAGSMDHQHLDGNPAQTVSLANYPITPAMSTGVLDHKGDPQSAQSLVMMPQRGQGQDQGMAPGMGLPEQPAWNPSRIFEQWHTTFGTPEQSEPDSVSPSNSVHVPSSTAVADVPTLDEIQAVNHATPPSSHHGISHQQFSVPPIPNFVTPAMWQESVASVYEGGLKRGWDFDGVPVISKRSR